MRKNSNVPLNAVEAKEIRLLVDQAASMGGNPDTLLRIYLLLNGASHVEAKTAEIMAEVINDSLDTE